MTSFGPAQPSSAVTLSLLDQLNFLPVPAGTARLGLEDKVAEKFINSYGEIWAEFFCRERPQHDVEVAAFGLARYPVTNSIFAQFIAADGYLNPEYWTPDGWAWRLNVHRTQPSLWNNPRYEGDDRPIVGLSWFEALALARWASVQTGMTVRLPTEAEWERAARDTNSKSLYPWGGAWDPAKLNSGVGEETETFHHGTVPIGRFSPGGDGPFGHGDLLGQVWEWTSSLFYAYPYRTDDGREDLYTPERRVLRGGNWSDGKYANRVTSRYIYPPNYSDLTTGMRLAIGGSNPAIPGRTRYDLLLYGRESFCADVVKVKQWLHAWNVPYRQLNVDSDEEAAFRLDEWLGTRTIPTLVVAARNGIDPVAEPCAADLNHLRNLDRGTMLHEPEESTLRAFLINNGFLSAS